MITTQNIVKAVKYTEEVRQEKEVVKKKSIFEMSEGEYLAAFQAQIEFLRELVGTLFGFFTTQRLGYRTYKDKKTGVIVKVPEFVKNRHRVTDNGYTVYEIFDMVKDSHKKSFEMFQSNVAYATAQSFIAMRYKLLKGYGVDIFKSYIDFSPDNIKQMEKQARQHFNDVRNQARYIGNVVKVIKAGQKQLKKQDDWKNKSYSAPEGNFQKDPEFEKKMAAFMKKTEKVTKGPVSKKGKGKRKSKKR